MEEAPVAACDPVTEVLWGVETGGWDLLTTRFRSRVSERPCLRGIRERIIEWGHPTSSSDFSVCIRVFLCVCSRVCAYVYTPIQYTHEIIIKNSSWLFILFSTYKPVLRVSLCCGVEYYWVMVQEEVVCIQGGTMQESIQAKRTGALKLKRGKARASCRQGKVLRE